MSPAQDLRILRNIRGAKRPHIKQLKELHRVLTGVEKLLYRAALVVCIVSALWLCAVVVRGYRVQVPAVGGTYKEAVVGEPELINPLFASLNEADQDIVRLVYSGLMRYDATGRLIPDLAAKIDVSADKTVYTASLRQDVLWHDGEAFDAEDVLFTIHAIQNQDVGSPLYVSFDGVEVSMLDTYTIQFTLQEPFPAFMQTLTVGMLPEHAWFDVQPERFPLSQKNLQPIGTGPFKFSKFSKDASGYIYEYELKRNEAYYRSPAYIETFVFAFYRSYDGEAGAIQDVRQQGVSALHFVPVDLKEKVERKHLTLRTLQLPQYTALFFNSTREPALSGEDVREALARSLDKRRMLREALDGEGQLIEGPILPGFPGFDPESGLLLQQRSIDC
jgi:peptide/nickel transport system substrate-binding protein